MRVGFGLGEAVGKDDQAAMLALADSRAKLLGLFERHPDRRAIAFLLGFAPEQQDIDATIGGAVMPQRSADASSDIFDIPRPLPGTHAFFQIGNNFAGDAGIDIGAGLGAGLHGLGSFVAGLSATRR